MATEIESITIVMCRAQGHINASLGLATRLRELGSDVRFVGPAEIAQKITSAGFDFRSLASFDMMRMPFGIARRPAELWSARSILDVVRKIRDGRREVARLRRSFDALQADLLSISHTHRCGLFLFDPFYLHLALPLMAAGHRVCVLSTKPLASPDPWVPPYTTHLRPGDKAFATRNWMIWRIHELKYRLWEIWEFCLAGVTFRQLVCEMGEHCGLPVKAIWATRPILFDTYFRNCPEWILHTPVFEFPRKESTDPSAFYVGPCVYHTRNEEVDEIPEGEGPLVFVALSTVRHRSRIPLRMKVIGLILEVALMRPQWRFVLAVGDQAAQIASLRVPSNLRVLQFAASIKTLSESSVLVCQAGANFVKEAVWSGVPMLLLPDRADQPGMAARVAHHGLGVVHRRTPSAVQICADIEHLITSHSVAKSVSYMQERFRDERENAQLLRQALSAVEGFRQSR